MKKLTLLVAVAVLVGGAVGSVQAEGISLNLFAEREALRGANVYFHNGAQLFGTTRDAKQERQVLGASLGVPFNDVATFTVGIARVNESLLLKQSRFVEGSLLDLDGEKVYFSLKVYLTK